MDHCADELNGDKTRSLVRDLLCAQRLEVQDVPISLAQQRLWFLQQLDPSTTAYNISVGLRFKGELDPVLLEHSLQAVIDRHEALRTTFAVRDGQVLQVVHPFRSVVLPAYDLSSCTDAELEREVYAAAGRELQIPFDLSGPLLRLALLRLRDDEHVLICVMHHIISDGWSMELFVDELTQNYDAQSRGLPLPLAPLQVQYADYAAWQKEWLRDDELERQLFYWKRKLQGAPAVIALPADRHRPDHQTFDGSSQTMRIPDHLVRLLKRLAQERNVTFFTLMLAAFEVLVFRYSGQDDILVGVPVAGRNRVEIEDLIGFFVNTIVLRTDLSGNPRFGSVLCQVRQTLLDALANQDVPFERLVEALGPPRGPGYNPLFQVMFATFKAAVKTRQIGKLTATPYIVSSSISRFDLGANLIEGPGEAWWIQLEYKTALFDHTRISRLLNDYRTLLSNIVANCDQRVSEFSLQASAELGHAETAPRSAKSDHRALASTLVRREFVPPRGPVERTLAELWEKVLKVSPIGVTDSFFDRGGHSLLAISLFSEVRRTFGKTLPLSTLFHEPTIDYMAKQLSAEPSTSSLIPLCATGSKPAFYAGGSNPRYLDLSRALGADQPFYTMDAYALLERRMLSEQPVYSTVEEIAADFVRDIISLQPAGPYFLGGACDGGVVALEAARQLQRQGREIGMFVSFDSPIAGYYRKRWPQTGLYMVRRGLSLLLSGNLASSIRKHVQRANARARLRKSHLVQLSSDEERYYYIWAAIWKAVFAYRNDDFLSQIIHIRADKQALHEVDTTAGWDKIAMNGAPVYGVPGDHTTMLTTHLQHFARTLSTILEQAQRQRCE